MHLRYALIGLSAVSLLCAGIAQADDDAAARTYADGRTLLANGDFAGALDAFKAAAKADPKNDEYFQESALLSRVIKVREQFTKEENPEVWQKMGAALFNYYKQYNVKNEALTMAETLHKKLNSPDSATRVADALLDLDRDQDASDLLARTTGDLPARGVALQGIAAARLEQTEAAQDCAGRLQIPAKDADPDLCFDAARLYTLLNKQDQALKALQTCFEMTPERFLDVIKTDAKDNEDLKPLASNAGFAKVMETKSKIQGCGHCSSKSGCGGCSSKSKSSCSDKSKKEDCSDHKHSDDNEHTGDHKH